MRRMKMTDSMTKYRHRMTAEESITQFIAYLNEDWLYQKGYEIFDTYYVDETIQVKLVDQDSKDYLEGYFYKVQETLGKMFAHIMLIEFKLYLLTQR
jgi:hypothetical protein